MRNSGNRSIAWLLAILVAVAIGGALRGSVLTLLTHGATWDEQTEIRGLRAQYRQFMRRFPAAEQAGEAEPQYPVYHGIVNKLPGLLLWRTAQVLRGEKPVGWVMDDAALIGLHLSGLGFLLVTAWAVQGCARTWLGCAVTGWLAVALLFLQPRFIGQSFFNLKDLPFAALYSIATWRMAVTLTSEDLRTRRRSSAEAIVSVGFLAAFKIVGIVALGPLVLAAICPTRTGVARTPGLMRAVWISSPLPALAVALAATPAAWSEPIQWLGASLGFFSHHPWGSCTMTWGECVPAQSIPRNYLLLWFAVTTPALHVLAVAGGLQGALAQCLAMWKGRPHGAGRASARMSAAALPILAQVFTLPVFSIAYAAPLYDGERQMLFVIPAICVLGASGLMRLHEASRRWLPYRIVGSLLVLGLTVTLAVDQVRLHPYQYVYFNEIGRQLDPSRNFETDYWAFSLGELARRHDAMLSGHPEWKRLPIRGLPVQSIEPFLRSSRRLMPAESSWLVEKPVEIRSPMRMLAVNRFAWRSPPLACEVVDQVERRLLFASEPLVLSRAMVCRPAPATGGASSTRSGVPPG